MSLQIYADTSDLEQIATYAQDPTISGFTTNPSLCRQAGVTDYQAWAVRVLGLIRLNQTVSFEVLADDLAGMEAEALEIGSWDPRVYVKIPIQTVTGDSTAGLIERLSHRIWVNVTAILTAEQADVAAYAMRGSQGILSIFAGRIADTGRNPVHAYPAQRRGTKLLWASTRQLRDFMIAEHFCDIITASPALLEKRHLLGKDLDQYSLETVQQFSRDAKAAGLTLKRAIVPAEAD